MRNKAWKSEKEGAKHERISLIKALTHVDYRAATISVIFIWIAFNISGLPLIIIGAKTIFTNIKNHGGSSSIT